MSLWDPLQDLALGGGVLPACGQRKCAFMYSCMHIFDMSLCIPAYIY